MRIERPWRAGFRVVALSLILLPSIALTAEAQGQGPIRTYATILRDFFGHLERGSVKEALQVLDMEALKPGDELQPGDLGQEFVDTVHKLQPIRYELLAEKWSADDVYQVWYWVTDRSRIRSIYLHFKIRHPRENARVEGFGFRLRFLDLRQTFLREEPTLPVLGSDSLGEVVRRDYRRLIGQEEMEEATGPIMVGGDVKAPRRVFDPQPAYTPEARESRIQGIVIIQATIDEKGNVTDTKVLKGLPMGLDEKAEEAVRMWRFEPATLDGKPVSVYYNITISFTLPR